MPRQWRYQSLCLNAVRSVGRSSGPSIGRSAPVRAVYAIPPSPSFSPPSSQRRRNLRSSVGLAPTGQDWVVACWTGWVGGRAVIDPRVSPTHPCPTTLCHPLPSPSHCHVAAVSSRTVENFISLCGCRSCEDGDGDGAGSGSALEKGVGCGWREGKGREDVQPPVL